MAKKLLEKIEIETDPKVLGWITKIRTFEGDIKQFKENVKVIEEQLQEKIENTDEYTEVLDLQAKLASAQERLKLKLSSDGDYNNLLEERAAEKDSLKSATQNLSDFILGYFHETGERQIETGPHNGRELVLSGRLGKERRFQTSLFGVKESK